MSWPASFARAAATAESTPPLIAAISFIILTSSLEPSLATKRDRPRAPDQSRA